MLTRCLGEVVCCVLLFVDSWVNFLICRKTTLPACELRNGLSSCTWALVCAQPAQVAAAAQCQLPVSCQPSGGSGLAEQLVVRLEQLWDDCCGDGHFKMLWCTEQLLFLGQWCLAGTRLSLCAAVVPWSVSAHPRAAWSVLLDLHSQGGM